MNIEHVAELVSYLRDTGRLQPGTHVVATPLPGGVSNRTVQVTFPTGQDWVLKQALPKLRVQDDWFADPARGSREAAALRWLEQLAPPGTVPKLLFEDPAHHLLAISAVAAPHQNWKERLLGGQVEPAYVSQFGRWLGEVHRRSAASPGTLVADLSDDKHFEALRLAPYYRSASARNPGQAQFFTELIAETRATHLCLVHGDYSPKNVLIHDGALVVLDFEVAHFGDPAFDLGFALTHLLSKARHLPPLRQGFLEAAELFWSSYRTAAETLGTDPLLEARAVRHTLACLLARVDGRSPLEYLTEAEREWQRTAVRQLMEQPPLRLPELIGSFGK